MNFFLLPEHHIELLVLKSELKSVTLSQNAPSMYDMSDLFFFFSSDCNI